MAGVFSFVPSVDKKSKEPFLPKHPIEMAKDGVSIPLILGYTNKEGYIMLPLTEDQSPQELKILGCKMEDLDKIDKNFQNNLHPRWIESLQKKNDLSPQDLKKLYFKDEKLSEKTLDQWADLNSDAFFVDSIHELVEHQVRNKSNSTFLYVMTYDGPFAIIKTMWGIQMPGKDKICQSNPIKICYES